MVEKKKIDFAHVLWCCDSLKRHEWHKEKGKRRISLFRFSHRCHLDFFIATSRKMKWNENFICALVFDVSENTTEKINILLAIRRL